MPVIGIDLGTTNSLAAVWSTRAKMSKIWMQREIEKKI